MGEPPEPPGSQYPTQQHALRTTDRHSNPALPLSGSSLPFTADCGPIWPTAAWSHVRPGSTLQEHQPRPLTDPCRDRSSANGVIGQIGQSRGQLLVSAYWLLPETNVETLIGDLHSVSVLRSSLL